MTAFMQITMRRFALTYRHRDRGQSCKKDFNLDCIALQQIAAKT